MDDGARRAWRWRRRPAPADQGRPGGAAGADRQAGAWDGVDRRRPTPRRGATAQVSPGLQALFDDLARLDGVVVPGALSWPLVGSEAPGAPPDGQHRPLAEVVDLAEFRLRRRAR